MGAAGYEWRRMSESERDFLLAERRRQERPWHSPPHRPGFGHRQFHITAACFEHRPHIGRNIARMDAFADDLVTLLDAHAAEIYA